MVNKCPGSQIGNSFSPTFTCSKSATEIVEKVGNMFTVNNKNNITSGAFIVNFEHISHLFLGALLLTFNK